MGYGSRYSLLVVEDGENTHAFENCAHPAFRAARKQGNTSIFWQSGVKDWRIRVIESSCKGGSLGFDCTLLQLLKAL